MTIPSVFGNSALGWVATLALVPALLASVLLVLPPFLALDWVIRTLADLLEALGLAWSCRAP